MKLAHENEITISDVVRAALEKWAARMEKKDAEK
jgi:Arc/MetJ-type ribon-helix-helix transcriptional regulator